MSLNSILL